MAPARVAGGRGSCQLHRAAAHYRDRRRREGAASPAPRAQLPGFRHPVVRPARQAAGYRARRRCRTGLRPARDGRRRGRQPHHHARRIGRAELRHRDLRDRARAGDANARVPAHAEPARHDRRRLAAGRHGEGPHHGADRANRRVRGERLRDRVHRQDDLGHERRRADDNLQHERRRRSTRCPGGARSASAGVPEGQTDGAAGNAVGPGHGRLAWSAQRSRRDLRSRDCIECERNRTDGLMGHEPGSVSSRRWPGPRPGNGTRSVAPPCDGCGAALHGARPGDASAGCKDRSRFHRLVHERPHRRPARRGSGGAGAARRAWCAGHGGARFNSCARPGRGRRPAPHLPRCGLRVAPVGLLDVRGDERRSPAARRAVRVEHQPELRRPPGGRRQDAPDEPGDGGGRRHRRPTRRRAHAGGSRWSRSTR